jgi:hypothetical protein
MVDREDTMSGAGDLLKDILGDVVGVLGTDDSIYVSPPPPNWDEAADPGSGTVSDPYHSIKTGITMAAGGRTVCLRGGQYIESVEVAGISGTRDRKIVVRPYRHERVTIDCIVPEFLNPTPLAHWKPVDNGGEDEFVWTQPFNGGQAEQVTRGAFLETCQHTRLITYHHLEDLRAANELDPHDGPTGDNHVWVRDPATGDMKATNPKRYRNWVYMGPGIWFDPDCRQVHIRLSHTHNGINGWPDYTGITDPREVKLALSKELSHALFFRHCSHIRFKDLTVRFGGQDTIRLRDCCDIEFDHVNIRAGSSAISLHAEEGEHNKKIVFQHCEVDGGIPTWLFRSDIKDGYFYVPKEITDATVDQVQENTLGVGTTAVLISSGENASEIHIHHCKIFNGHDTAVFGDQMRFHHNWMHNFNDDLYVQGKGGSTNDAWIYRNVITQCLTALSFAAKDPAGQVRIFRNLIDIRQPTLGTRPGHPGDNPFRQGQLYKDSNELEGPFDLWHNTCLVLNAGATTDVDGQLALNVAGFNHYKRFEDKDHNVACRRRAYNNIFVAAYPFQGIIKPIAFLPPNTFQGPTDGNTYHRVGPQDPNQDRFEVTGDSATYPDISDYNQVHKPWEDSGRRENPEFVSFDHCDGYPHPDDDLRLQDGSPAKNKAIPMPADMANTERTAGGILAWFFGHDRGCYWASWDRMWVGVGGLERFPR